jgi:hypothetical protein
MQRNSSPLVVIKPFAHADHRVPGVSDSLVKLNDCPVGLPHLKVDFGTPGGSQSFLCFLHDPPADSLPPVMRRDSQIIDPASVTFITSQAGGDNMAAKEAHQEPLRVHLEFSLDVSSGIVLRDDQVALQPELNHGFLILRLIRPNQEIIHHSAPINSWRGLASTSIGFHPRSQ